MVSKQKVKVKKEVPVIKVEQVIEKPKVKSFSFLTNWFNKEKNSLIDEQVQKANEKNTKFFQPKPYIIYEPKDWKDIKKQLMKMEVNQKQSKILLIHMQLINGKHTQFVVPIQHDSFMWENKRFIVDEKLLYFDVTAKLFCLDYYEGFCLPIKRDFGSDEIIKKMAQDGEEIYENLLESESVGKVVEVLPRPDLVYSTHSENLERFIQSHVIEKVIKGQEMEDIFSFIKLMLIINSVILTILTLVSLYVAFRK